MSCCQSAELRERECHSDGYSNVGAGGQRSACNINFGTFHLGSIVTQTVTVKNTGNAALSISDPLIAIVQGGNSDEFMTVDLCAHYHPLRYHGRGSQRLHPSKYLHGYHGAEGDLFDHCHLQANGQGFANGDAGCDRQRQKQPTEHRGA